MAQTYFIKFARQALFGAALGVLGTFSFVGGAQAATCSPDAVTIDGDAAQACNGPISGNDTGGGSSFLDDLSNGDIFAGYGNINLLMDWELFGKSDEDLTVEADEGSIFGEFAAFGVMDTLVVTLKAGSNFTAFLFTDIAGPNITGTFDTFLAGLLNNQGRAQNLSHLSIFEAGDLRDDPGPSPVPLPAAGWLLLAGLGGLTVARRRRKS